MAQAQEREAVRAALERLLVRKVVVAKVAPPAWATEVAVRAALESRVVRAVVSKAADLAVVVVAAPKVVAMVTVRDGAIAQTIEAMETTASS